MRAFTFFLLLGTVFSMKLAPDTRRNVVYIDWRVSSWEDLGVDIRNCVDNGFNVIYIAFWMWSGIADAAVVWANTMSAAQRQAAMDYAHARGAVVMVAAGGATDLLRGPNLPAPPIEYCSQASNWAIEYGLDGVDFDIELIPGDPSGFLEGWANDWLVQCSLTARQILGTNREISHAPQGPYFGTWAGPTKGYIDIDRRAGSAVDYYNIQFYNQGVGTYETFDELFVRTGPGIAEETAISEIVANGVAMNKLVVGKPLLTTYAGSGFVPVTTLGNFVQQARSQLGWEAGVMTWMYEPTAALTNWGRTIAGSLGSKNQNSTVIG